MLDNSDYITISFKRLNEITQWGKFFNLSFLAKFWWLFGRNVDIVKCYFAVVDIYLSLARLLKQVIDNSKDTWCWRFVAIFLNKF